MNALSGMFLGMQYNLRHDGFGHIPLFFIYPFLAQHYSLELLKDDSYSVIDKYVSIVFNNLNNILLIAIWLLLSYTQHYYIWSIIQNERWMEYGYAEICRACHTLIFCN